jgi:hypothetical protein
MRGISSFIKHLNGTPLQILCLLTTGSTNTPMVLNPITYWKPFKTKDMKANDVHNKSSYAHITVGKCKIIPLIPKETWDKPISKSGLSIQLGSNADHPLSYYSIENV